MKKILVLSPHLDDALLSCGTFLLHMSELGHEVLILNIFTSFGTGKMVQEVASQLSKMKKTVKEFEIDRKVEDQNAWKNTKIKKLNLKIVDGGFRLKEKPKNKDLELVYQDFNSLFSGKISKEDEQILQYLQKVLHLIEKKCTFDIVVSPYGVGRHSDHILTKNAAKNVWPKSKLFYYLDQPYYAKKINISEIELLKLKIKRRKIIQPSYEKIRRIIEYKTQVPLLFSSSSELFFNEVLLLDR